MSNVLAREVTEDDLLSAYEAGANYYQLAEKYFDNTDEATVEKVARTVERITEARYSEEAKEAREAKAAEKKAAEAEEKARKAAEKKAAKKPEDK